MDTPSFISGVSAYKPLTDDELVRLAQDIKTGRVLASWQVPADIRPRVFMFMYLLDDFSFKKLRRDGIEHLYQHVSMAFRSHLLNGFPVFTSANGLSEDDRLRLVALTSEGNI